MDYQLEEADGASRRRKLIIAIVAVLVVAVIVAAVVGWNLVNRTPVSPEPTVGSGDTVPGETVPTVEVPVDEALASQLAEQSKALAAEANKGIEFDVWKEMGDDEKKSRGITYPGTVRSRYIRNAENPEGAAVLQVEMVGADVDADADGLSDWLEKQAGTDPRNPDTDGDGWKDGEEVNHGFDPKVADPHEPGTPIPLPAKKQP